MAICSAGLIQAHAEKSESMLQEVRSLIQTLLEGWIGAMDNLECAECRSCEDAAASEPARSGASAAAALRIRIRPKPGRSLRIGAGSFSVAAFQIGGHHLRDPQSAVEPPWPATNPCSPISITSDPV